MVRGVVAPLSLGWPSMDSTQWRTSGFGRQCTSAIQMEAVMLEKIAAEEVKRIAGLAKAAREARDLMLEKIPDGALGQSAPAKGEHNPAAALGLEPLPADHPDRLALKGAIGAIADATTPFEVTAEALMEESDLSAFLLKGLYEMKLM
jgi:hypothetical protein